MKNAIALGTFDGVHIGHQKVLAMPEDFKKTVVTFSKSPRFGVEGYKGLIITQGEKERLLKEIGIDEIYTMDFSKVKDISPKGFLEFLKESFNPSYISCGFNYRFGKNGKGDTALLSRFCQENSIQLSVADEVRLGEETVSSTKIRELIEKGDLCAASKFLGRDYSFTVTVVEGEKRGRSIGFPTINQRFPNGLATPKFGVYSSFVEIEGNKYSSITDIGVRPTYKLDYVIAETYINDFSGDLYGKEIRVYLKEFLREERKFGSINELKEQINKDIKSIKNN